MSERTISSRLTPLYKFGFPLMTAGATVTALRMPGDFHSTWILWAVATVVVFFVSGSLKKVRLCSDCLLVSNYFRQIRIPFTNIRKVSENFLINIRPVTIHLREPSDFGKRIAFIPKARLLGFLSENPVVQELADAVNREQR